MAKLSSIFVLLGVLIASLLSSCTTSFKHSTDDFVDKDYEVEHFNKIKLEGGYNVQIKQSDSSSFKMNTSEELHKKVKVWVDNDVLHVRSKVKDISTDEIKLFITVNELEDIDIEGGVFLTTKGVINVTDLNIYVKGGAHIDVELNAKKIRARAEGGVNMEFKGKSDEFIATTEGAGNIDADELEAKNVKCTVTGVGNASVYATEKLDATLEGLGKIGYRGNPTINKQVNGIGIIYKK